MNRFRHLVAFTCIVALVVFAASGCSQQRAGINQPSSSSDSDTGNATAVAEATAGEITEIDRGTFVQLAVSQNRTLIYIGRPNCPDCKEFYPEFEQWVKDAKRVVYYYNTYAKASQKAEMKAFYNGYGVMEVPAVMEIEGGETKQILIGGRLFPVGVLFSGLSVLPFSPLSKSQSS